MTNRYFKFTVTFRNYTHANTATCENNFTATNLLDFVNQLHQWQSDYMIHTDEIIDIQQQLKEK